MRQILKEALRVQASWRRLRNGVKGLEGSYTQKGAPLWARRTEDIVI